jgi:hypothetical protein
LLTTDTPESQSATKAIIATRPKPEAATTKLQIGDRVVVGLTSFTVLPPRESRKKSQDTQKIQE